MGAIRSPWKLGLRALVACVLAIVAVPAVAAAFGAPTSMLEAEAVNDPAASAGVFEIPDVYTYQGSEISEAAAKDLVCVETAKGNRCFDSIFDAEAGMNTDSPAAQAAGDPEAEAAIMKQLRAGDPFASSSGSAAKAVEPCVLAILFTWKHPNYQVAGGQLALSGHWIDLNANNNNTTTSYITGELRAHLSDYSGGGGYWYPGNTGRCALKPTLRNTGWNNRITSRYRY
jgi:hypothetical protein